MPCICSDVGERHALDVDPVAAAPMPFDEMAVKRGEHGVVLAHPKGLAPTCRRNPNVQNGQRATCDLLSKARGDYLCERRVRLDRDDPKAALKVVGGVVAVVGADVDDQIGLEVTCRGVAGHPGSHPF